MKSLLLLVALSPAVALAQTPPPACPLLTNAEIAAATGKSVGASHDTNMTAPSGKAKGMKISGCMWRLGEQGMVNVSVMPAVGSKEDREQGLAKLRQTYEVLKTRGWEVSETKIGDSICNSATPPKAESNDAPAMVGCFAVSKGFVYSVGIVGPHFNVPPQKAKTLADALAKRLP